mmetsp:Transcript_31727/g.73635  ORF Transcript_31727/g.73635 Transcript_31727/m.73635 type:complete len:227 (-) Transcript_31727:166-846(-)|eukprot:CAMPEP_0171059442 /NCGR_PEP_ID=MMETSP0766_2-20121228/3177_1 /TAXON_ID=439317 /ORGANISM="Gambierdiscus australes, Strain CAWD 149" /LENGTH=226 /DNA_ID=CAMNT_0011514877 /DNA_START=142 /DNA_END=822 /DNA_ORIENTATION=-
MDLGGGFVNSSVAVAGLGSVVLTAIGMFGPVVGGNMDPKVWFAWHPIFMSLAFPCLMTYGKWVYVVNDDRPLSARRTLHGVCMSTASLAMLIGYLCIFMAHLPQEKFFGYDFKNGKWAEYRRVVHVYLGYLLICAVLVQALVGARKLQLLGKGQRTLTFHGKLGKVIMVLAGLNIIIAVRFWAWKSSMKVPLYIFVIASTVFATVWPSKEKVGFNEDEQLLTGTAA